MPGLAGLRPTSDRVRETLFNWLAPWIDGARCLDLFAGSGALGLEAASRGAQRVVLVERHATAAANLRRQAELLRAPQVEIIQQDALRFLVETQESFDVVFLDPPFGENLLRPACATLEQTRGLASSSWIYLEMERVLADRDGLTLPAEWKIQRRLQTREAACWLVHRETGEQI